MCNTSSSSSQLRPSPKPAAVVRHDAATHHQRRRRLAAALVAVLLASGCGSLTDQQVRTALAAGATQATVNAFSTGFTSIVGATLQTVLTRVLDNLVGVKPILR